MSAPSFSARLDADMDRLGSLVCVGLDPHPERLAEPAVDACRRIVDATIEAAVAFKPNSAFFELDGAEGMAALRTVIDHIGGERIVLLDAKRGDVGSTARAYARAAFETLGADALTVNPYLGGDAVGPFLQQPTHGAFVLCHTSNEGAQDLQHIDIGGEPLYLEVARLARGWNTKGNVGLVVGATYPRALERVRAAAPELPILAPGIGAQGGDLAEAVAVGVNDDERGLLVSSSRAIFFADDPGLAARRLRDGVNAARQRSGRAL